MRAVNLTILFSVVLWSLLGLPNVSAGTDKERAAKLIEGAKKEGKMVLYGAMSLNHSTLLLNRFKEKYPFIKADLYRGTSLGLINKIMSEAKANRHQVDVIQTSGFQTHIIKKEGLLQNYVSPENQAYPEDFKDPAGFWNSIYLIPYVMGSNALIKTKPLFFASDAIERGNKA